MKNTTMKDWVDIYFRSTNRNDQIYKNKISYLEDKIEELEKRIVNLENNERNIL